MLPPNSNLTMRYFIYLAYDGKNYHGWQIQPNANSIQAELMRVLTLLSGKQTEVIGAGRTDAEVNASMMVAHFDCEQDFTQRQTGQSFEEWLCHKLNRMLPQDIAIQKVERVNDEAHARFSALSRTYQYHITTGKNAFSRHYSYRYPHPLDFNRMNEAAARLFDYTDFTSFSKLHTDTKTNICKIMKAEWKQVHYETGNTLFADGEWVFTIKADRFLRNMVRAVVGTLIEVGRGAMTVDGFCQAIEKKGRQFAGSSVPGNALFLTDIEYPESVFELQQQ